MTCAWVLTYTHLPAIVCVFVTVLRWAWGVCVFILLQGSSFALYPGSRLIIIPAFMAGLGCTRPETAILLQAPAVSTGEALGGCGS